MVFGRYSRPPGACSSRILGPATAPFDCGAQACSFEFLRAKADCLEFLGAKACSFEFINAGSCCFEGIRSGAFVLGLLGASCSKTARVCTDTPSPPHVGPHIGPCIDREFWETNCLPFAFSPFFQLLPTTSPLYSRPTPVGSSHQGSALASPRDFPIFPIFPIFGSSNSYLFSPLSTAGQRQLSPPPTRTSRANQPPSSYTVMAERTSSGSRTTEASTREGNGSETSTTSRQILYLTWLDHIGDS